MYNLVKTFLTDSYLCFLFIVLIINMNKVFTEKSSAFCSAVLKYSRTLEYYSGWRTQEWTFLPLCNRFRTPIL